MLFLTIEAQEAFLCVGSGDCWEITCYPEAPAEWGTAASIFPLSFVFAVFPSHIPLPISICSASRSLIVALFCAKVLPLLKTWMIVFTSGRRACVYDVSQEQNLALNTDQRGC